MFKIIEQSQSDLSDKQDTELVKAIQSNSVEKSRREISELYHRYASDIYRMTKSLHDHNSDVGEKAAQDLFQEAWRVALEKIGRYNLNASTTFGAWVKGIADNLFLEDYRANAKLTSANLEIGRSFTLGEGGEPIDELSDDQESEEENSLLMENGLIRKENLLAALEVLSSNEKEVLTEWFRTFDKNDPGGKTHSDNLSRLSEKLGIQKDSIRKIKQRAIDKIQKRLRL